ncbi:MAG: multifunctional CCA addition/repair protein [Betaproteobacteria bacterium]|nr:multifunctional CCA addition/repair protein [Betaproteobacteria bacterium]
MKIYAVGGAVRDELLSRPVEDRDYVVVGATPEQMIALGYKPVGRDFPVFLHPQTHEEYALARTERKTARGYHGFAFYTAADVTLEQDLARRDLTINAIARDEHGALIDPFNGARDLKAGVLRHVSAAFAEDPVRILRVARFAARFGFTIADETLALMQQMVNDGEADALMAERVWQELSRGLMEDKPSRMFDALRACGALARVLPEVDALWGVPQRAAYHPEVDTGVHVMMVLDYAASRHYALDVRFAALTHDLGKATTPREQWPRHTAHEARSAKLVEALSERLRVPNECRDLARVMAKHHGAIHRADELRPGTIVDLLQSADAFRKPERFTRLLQVCESDKRGRLGLEHAAYPPMVLLSRALSAAAAVDAGAIAQRQSEPEKIKAALHQARVEAVRAALRETG